MKIIVIVPFFLYKESTLPKFVPADVDVIGVGPRGVFGEGRSDIAYTSSYVMDAVVDAEKRGYDAAIIGGGPGPLIDEARELVDIPVLGSGQVAAYISLLLGHKQGILCSSLPTRRWMEQNVVRKQGLDGKIVVRDLKATSFQCRQEYYKYKESGGKITPFIDNVVERCIKLIEEDDVGVISFASGGLIWIPDIAKKQLKERGYDITIVNPILTAIEIARALVTLKLTHSRISYPKIIRTFKE